MSSDWRGGADAARRVFAPEGDEVGGDDAKHLVGRPVLTSVVRDWRASRERDGHSEVEGKGGKDGAALFVLCCVTLMRAGRENQEAAAGAAAAAATAARWLDVGSKESCSEIFLPSIT